MSHRNTLTGPVTPVLKSFVGGRLASDRVANARGFFRAALRLMERREPDLRAARSQPTVESSAGC